MKNDISMFQGFTQKPIGMKHWKVQVNFLFSSKQHLTHEGLINIHKIYTKQVGYLFSS
jgi:hypothetical protein